MVNMMKLEKAPKESYTDIGGRDQQITETKESVELLLTHPEYYEEMGIKPLKGFIRPARNRRDIAPKSSRQSDFCHFSQNCWIRVRIQKHLGDGPKLVRELFRVANESSPSIVFIDEVDAVGTKRYDSNSGGEREIQRTIESLDLALIRPGRVDRKIEFPMPD